MFREIIHVTNIIYVWPPFRVQLLVNWHPMDIVRKGGRNIFQKESEFEVMIHTCLEILPNAFINFTIMVDKMFSMTYRLSRNAESARSFGFRTKIARVHSGS